MKIMVVGLRGFPKIAGGVESHCENLYPLLVSKDCEIEVVGRSAYLADNYSSLWKGVKITRLWSPKKTGLETILHTLLGVFYAGFKRPNILHIHSIGPALFAPLARLFGLKVIVTYHAADYRQAKWGKFATWLLLRGERNAVQFANEIICVSKHAALYLQQEYGRTSYVIPNGVHHIDYPSSCDVLTSLGITKGKYFLHVGRAIPDKCQDDLISAFLAAKLQDWKLVIVGDFSEENVFNSKVKTLAEQSEQVILAGFRSGDELKALFAAAGTFVLPSRVEGLPIALLEALSAGVPCVASEIAANKELDLPQECYFPVGNVTELATKLSSPEKIRAAADWNRLKQSIRVDFDWNQIALKTHKLYLRVLE